MHSGLYIKHDWDIPTVAMVDVTFEVSFDKELAKHDVAYVFCTVLGRGTDLFQITHEVNCVTLESLAPDSKVLVTAIRRGTEKHEFVIAGSAIGTLSKGANDASAAKHRMVRANGAACPTISNGTATISAALLDFRQTVNSKTVKEDPLYEFRVCPADGVNTWDLSYGHPSLQDVWFAGGNPVSSGLWDRYVHRACILMGLNIEAITDALLTDDKSIACIASVALQSCTGYYENERSDDRGAADLLFGQNIDCDDQSATVCALFYALKQEQQPSSNRVCEVIRHYVIGFEEAVVVLGMARNPSKPKTSKPFGHAWAALLRSPGDFNSALHIEATAPLVVNAPAILLAESTRVFDCDTYNLAMARVYEEHPDLKSLYLVGVRICEEHFYDDVCYAVSNTAQYMWPQSGSKINWVKTITGNADLVHPQPRSRVGPVPDGFFHKPNRLVHLPVGFATGPYKSPVDASSLRTWKAVELVPHFKHVPGETVIIDPFTKWRIIR